MPYLEVQLFLWDQAHQHLGHQVVQGGPSDLGGGGERGTSVPKEGVGVRGRRWSMGVQVPGVPGVPESPLSPGNPFLPDRPIGPGWPSVPFRPGVPDGPGEEEGKDEGGGGIEGGRGREDSGMFHKIYPPYFFNIF